MGRQHNIQPGRKYVDRVSQLTRTEDGTLVAWVSGTDQYITSVRPEEGGVFDYLCSCPYNGLGPCKHVVAVLLTAVDLTAENAEIPLLDPDDDLFLDFQDEKDLWEEVDDIEDWAGETPVDARRQLFASLLADKSHDELQEMLINFALLHPEVARSISESAQLELGQIDALTRALRREIRRLTDEDAWYNPWKGEGNLPDYSHIEEQLQVLLDAGHADAVLQLGEELWERGNAQVGQSHDEGETTSALGACLSIVVRALPRTTMNPPEQLLWYIDHHLEDEYSLLEGDDDLLQDDIYTASHWLEVADNLEQRLRKMARPKSGSFSETYQRQKVMNWLRDAYQHSGQPEKIIPLLESEAEKCRSYTDLVEALLTRGQRDKARTWCIEGFTSTLKEAPGIASQLQERLREMAEEDGNRDMVAAYRAEDFFSSPSLTNYKELGKAAEKITLWPEIRQGALAFLHTGDRPDSTENADRNWPLPEPEVHDTRSTARRGSSENQNRKILLEIAIFEARQDDAVTIFRQLKKAGGHWTTSIDRQLAEAVEKTHPEVALQIWQDNALRLIGEVKPKVYPGAAACLRHMQKIYEANGLHDTWKSLLKDVRKEHRSKRRLMEVLDDLEKKSGKVRLTAAVVKDNHGP